MKQLFDVLLGLVCLFGGIAAVIGFVYYISYGLAKLGLPLLMFGLLVLIFGQRASPIFKVVALFAVILGIVSSLK